MTTSMKPPAARIALCCALIALIVIGRPARRVMRAAFASSRRITPPPTVPRPASAMRKGSLMMIPVKSYGSP
jgi:hypothetical protein